MILTEGSSSATTTPNKTPPRVATTTTNTGTKRTGGRSRRRRHVTNNTDSTDDVNSSLADEKENCHCSATKAGSSRRNASATTIKSKDKCNFGLDETTSFGSFDEENTPSIDLSSSSPCTTINNLDTAAEEVTKIYKNCVKDFRRSLKKVSVSSSLWREFPDLVDTLVRISLSRSSTTDSLCLDGHTSALLSLCRKLIKDVTEATTTTTTTTTLTNDSTHTTMTASQQQKEVSAEDNFFVAVHILRSIAFVFASTATVEKKESLLKLFYHLIITATEKANNDKKCSSSSSSSFFIRSKLITLAGYEGLAKVLSHYSMKQKYGGNYRILSFQLVRYSSIDNRVIFAIPSKRIVDSNSKESSSLLYGHMSVRQISTIALKTTIHVAKAVLSLQTKLDDTSTTEKDFQKILSNPSSYGSIASIISDDEKGLHLHQVASEVIQRVHGPWMVLLASTSIAEREAAKEVISYSKSVHRLLWDVASTLQSSYSKNTCSSEKNKIKSVERDCLNLRKHAIIHLLPRTNIPKLDLLIRKTSLESASTYAWKAAVVYAQHLSSMPNKTVPSNPDFICESLSSFYSDLDSVFFRLLAMDDIVPLGFVEYTAYRSLHGGPKVNSLLPAPGFYETNMEKDEILKGNYRILLNILELGISSKTRIEEYTRSSKSIAKEQCQKENSEEIEIENAKISVIDSMIQVFNHHVTNRLNKFTADIQSRILKVLCNLSLQKTLFTAMKCDLSVSITAIGTELQVGASILSECLGPFVSTLMERCPQKASQLVDLMTECFLRPLSLYEQLSVVHGAKGHDDIFRRYLHLSKNICKNISDILIDCSHPEDLILPVQQVRCIEKVAKSMYLIARQRNEKSLREESLFPLLYSLKVYDSLDIKNNENKDYQLSSRFFLLSSTFQMLEKVNESLFVACLVINYESTNYQYNASPIIRYSGILNFVGEKSYGLLPPIEGDVTILPQISRSLCRQIATNLTKAEKRKTYKTEEVYTGDFCIASGIESLLADHSDNATTFQAVHPIDFIRLLLDFDSVSNNEERYMNMFSVTEILRQVGQSIQQLSCDSDSDFNENQLENALNNYSYLHELLQKSFDGLNLECPLVAKGLLGLIAAAGIVPCIKIGRSASSSQWKNGVNTHIIDTAIAITKESLRNLKTETQDDCVEKKSWSLLSESLRITLRFLLVMLQRDIIETSHYDDLLSDCVSVAKSIVNSGTFTRNNDILLRAKYWAVWTVTKLQNELESIGDYDRAAILSLWALALAEKIEPYQPWFYASMVTACADEGNLLRLKDSIVTASFNKCLPPGSAIWIFEKEFQLCQLRIAALQCGIDGQDSFYIQMQKVEDIRVELERCTLEESDKLFALYTWVLSTVYLTKSDIAFAFGCYPTALKAAQICQKCCQIILKRASLNSINHDNWISAIATSTVLARTSQRYIHILSRRPKLHYRMGDHRKALAYMRSILEYLNIDPIPLTPVGGQGIVLNDLTTSLKIAPQVRLFLEMKSWASTPDMTMQDFSNISPHDLTYHYLPNTNQSNSSIVHSIQDLIAVGDILYGDSVPIGFQQNSGEFYQEAVMLMTESAKTIQENSLIVPIKVEENLGMPIFEQVKLRDVRRLLVGSLELDEDSVVTIRDLCAQIEGSDFSCSEDKKWSLYYLGVLELDNARRSGALQAMWNKHECDDNPSCSLCNEKSIRAARSYLSRSSLYASKASDIFTRNILRSLALAEGPNINNGVGKSAGILILKSIGQSIRRRLTWSFGQVQESESTEREEMMNLQDIFGTFDGPCTSDPGKDDDKIVLFLKELAVRTPGNWKFLAPVICPSGEILITILKKTPLNPNEFVISSTCIFPSAGESAYDDIMKPLDSILNRVQEQLHGVDQSDVSESDDKEAIKRQWWDERNQLDAELCGLLEKVESLFFSKIFGDVSLEDISESSASSENFDEFPCGNLTSRFEAAINDSDDDISDSEVEREKKRHVLKKLTVSKLKDRLIEAGANNSQFRSLRKSDLIDLLIHMDQDNESSEVDTGETVDSEPSKPDSCLFLILDENLHRFPFEGMPILKGKTVCRVPCITFVLATLSEFDADSKSKSVPFVDPSSVSYVVDPENNLQATQKRILPTIESLSSSRNWNWDGVVGEIPPTSLFSQGLGRKNGLTMYFGHGGAQVCFSRRRVEELIDFRVSGLLNQSESDTKSPCNASVLLMGCSSGRLVSINRKNSDSIEQTPLYYEPEGVALSYLCAGAPCVVGNLWDVTDNDIDRFSVSLLQQFFDERHSDSNDTHQKRNVSLAESVSVARSACKLKHLVGCAPVCYGVPVFLKSTTS